jgi:hypothetical protein
MTEIQTLLNAKKVRLAEIREINSRLQKLGVDTSYVKVTKIALKPKSTIPKKKASHQVPIVATVSSIKLYLTSQGVKYNASASKAELETIVRENFMVRKVNEFHKKQQAE